MGSNSGHIFGVLSGWLAGGFAEGFVFDADGFDQDGDCAYDLVFRLLAGGCGGVVHGGVGDCLRCLRLIRRKVLRILAVKRGACSRARDVNKRGS